MALCTSCGTEVPEGTDFCEPCRQQSGKKRFAVYKVKDPSTGPLYEVPIGHYFRTGWQTFKLYPAGFIAFNLIMLLVIAGQIFLAKKLGFIGFLLGIPAYPLFVGDNIVSAKLLQKRPCIFADFFSGFHYCQPLIIFGFIFGSIHKIDYFSQSNAVLLILGEMIFIVVSILYLFTPLLIVDRRLRLWPAMELSRRMVQRRPGTISIFVFWGSLISIAGIFALGVGLLVTMPVVSCAITAAYADLFGLQSKEY